MRTEKDFLGQMEIEEQALYGIHSARARINFPGRLPFQKEWYMAAGLVKLACYQTVLMFIDASIRKYGKSHLPVALHDAGIFESLSEAALEVSVGRHFEHFIVPAVQGGAGTSANMNINEIIANAALVKRGHLPGTYGLIDPLAHANIFQSTNDVIPTALKIASMQLLSALEQSVNGLRSSVETLEKEHRGVVRLAYTQMQGAVPSSFGLLFGAYSEALSRDWWRISKCFERLKLVNLGGGAAGTGIGIPRFFIAEVLPNLQKLTGMPLARSENLADATQNLDAFVEVHATLKALAVNLEKMASDIRLLSSDLHGSHAVQIPGRQAGSSIMPGKVNPVIPEYVISTSHKVYSNDMLISGLCGQGVLDLNPYIPLIGHAFLESLVMLSQAIHSFHHHAMNGLIVHPNQSLDILMMSPAITTALVPFIGYEKATGLALLMKEKHISIFEANAMTQSLPESRLEALLKPDKLLQLGYSLKDL